MYYDFVLHSRDWYRDMCLILFVYRWYSVDTQSNGHVSLSGVPRNFVRGGSTNSVEDRGQRERESGGSSLLVGVSGGSCNLVQEISFHIVTFS